MQKKKEGFAGGISTFVGVQSLEKERLDIEHKEVIRQKISHLGLEVVEQRKKNTCSNYYLCQFGFAWEVAFDEEEPKVLAATLKVLGSIPFTWDFSMHPQLLRPLKIWSAVDLVERFHGWSSAGWIE